MSSDRKHAVHSIDLELAKKLVADFDEGFEVESVERATQGKSTSNYIVKQKDSHEKLILRILPKADESCRKELGLFHLLGDYVPIPEIYYTNETGNIIDKPYQIVEYMPGITLADYLLQGNNLTNELIEDIAEKSALIHRTVYEKEGSLNALLEIVEELPPIKTWFSFFLERLAGERLGDELKHELSVFINQNRTEFDEICSYFVLSHGDFRPDNILIFEGKLEAIIDWENALSAPLYFDIGQFFRYGELFPRKTERVFIDAYNANSIMPLDKNWLFKSRLMDCVNLLCLLELPNISQEWQTELIRKIRESIKK